MIPVVVAPPTSPPRRRRTQVWVVRAMGLVLVAAGVFGAAVWIAGFSPAGFERFDLAGGARTVRVDAPGDLVLYEERVDGGLPQLASFSVTGPDGRPVVVRPPAGVTDGAVARSLPLFEAWELGRFGAAEPGPYTIAALRQSGGGNPGSATLAVAPARTATWLGGWVGLGVLAGMPLAIGVGVLWAGGRASRSRDEG